MLSMTHFTPTAAMRPPCRPMAEDVESKPSGLELLGPAAFAAAALVGARLLNVVAHAMG